MANKDKRVIGLMVEDLFEDYTKEIIRNVYDALPADGSIRLVVMAGKFDGGTKQDDNVRAYKRICNSVYQMGSLCDFDGLIISLGSLSRMGAEQFESGFLKSFLHVPKVFIAADIENCVTVKYDSEAGIREAVDLLTNVNGFSRLCMLGGREDNSDAVERREIFKGCMAHNGVAFRESAYAGTDMSENCVEEAGRLLDENPDAEAVFCVNDAVAKGLYAAMKSRGLVPGRDVMVFGFDNTRMSGEMSPPLASIGPSEQTVGQKALELLLAQLDGESVESELVPTKLYARMSLDYEAYDYPSLDLMNMNEAFIYRMFDDCFYRYKNERYDREKVNLKRLFFEFISRILHALKNRYMSDEEFAELTQMADIFIENGAMEYTDTRKFMNSIQQLQIAVNVAQKSVSVSVKANRLFLRLKDKLIYALAEQKEGGGRKTVEDRDSLQRFLVDGTDYMGDGKDRVDTVVRNLGSMGVQNAALYMFDKPMRFTVTESFPEEICLRCILKEGEAYIPPADRQRGRVRDMFSREELSAKCGGYLAFPVFCGTNIYGVLACELSGNIYDRGEFIADQLGRAVCMNDKSTASS